MNDNRVVRYNWITNISKEEEVYARQALQLIKADYKITPLARDFNGEILKDHRGVWIAEDQFQTMTGLFFQMFSKLYRADTEKNKETANEEYADV